MTGTVHNPLHGKIIRRIVPYLMLIYMVAFLDRVNISFAALTMNRDLGISETIYGFAAGVFFLSYCLFQVPANILLSRLGARRWLGTLMVLWGIDVMATAFVNAAPSYISARLLLGIAESGFYPGIIFYFTFWMPPSARTRILALFLLSLPLCNAIGSPISAHILLLNGWHGMHGWQWLFLMEGAPAIVLGIATWYILTDTPQTARWLTAGEKAQLARDIQSEQPKTPTSSGRTITAVIRDAAVYFLWSSGNYGLIFFLPKILTARGASTLAAGWWATLTFGVGALAMYFASRTRGFRILPLLIALAALGFAAVALVPSLPVTLIGFCTAAIGLMASVPIFWSLAASRLSGKAAGTAIAIVNSVGAVGAFFGPQVMGWLHDKTHTYIAGIWVIAACVLLGAILVIADARAPRHTPIEGARNS
ncbi:MFS transporter [Acidobacteria bacterium AB60]|nr:MFS transporter [Acidobacteria bacterium AB60]